MMKQSDFEILKHLRENARVNITEISRKTGIPTSTVFLRIKDHEDSIIKKHASLIDFSKLGFNNWQKIAIKLGDPNKEKLKTYLMENKNINSVFQINGDYDYFIETVHRNVKEYIHFMEHLESKFNIVEIKEFQIIDDLKRECFVGD